VLSTARAGPVEDSELRRISCFPSHSGHRAVVHRSRSETCRTRLTPWPFVPKQHGRNRRANWPRPKVAGASFLQQGYGNDSTHYPHPCRRHHDRAVTGLWLASLHDGKRGTSQISQSASLFAATPTTRRSARAFATTRTRGRARAFATTRTRGSARAFSTTRNR
jgi:hypothetical protein